MKVKVRDIREAVKGMDDDDDVELDMADPPPDTNFVITGVGNFGGTLMISVEDGDDEDDEEEDEE